MKLLAAADRNWAIGRGGDQLVYIPADLKRFRELTRGGTVVLGRKTLSTFPGGRPLKGRRNLILSATEGFAPEGAEVFPNLEALLAAAPEDAFVIGGESVYRALLPYCDTAYVTRLDAAFPADRYLPNLEEDGAWTAAEESAPLEHQGLVFRYVTYLRAGKRGNL